MTKLSNHEAPEGRPGVGKPCLPMSVDPKGTSRIAPAGGEDDRRSRTEKVFRWIARDYKTVPILSTLETS
jgi:hypothetical protein